MTAATATPDDALGAGRADQPIPMAREREAWLKQHRHAFWDCQSCHRPADDPWTIAHDAFAAGWTAAMAHACLNMDGTMIPVEPGSWVKPRSWAAEFDRLNDDDE